MKIIGFTIFFISMISIGQQSQELFLQANSAYDSGDLIKARDLYTAIAHKGEAVWYNLGVVYYEQEDYIHSLLALLNAQKEAIWRDFDSIEHALCLVREKLGFKCLSGAANTLNYFMRKGATLHSLLGWQLIFIMLFIMMLFSFVVLSKRKRFFMVSILLLLLMGTSALIIIKNRLLHEEYGIVVRSGSNLYVAPDKNLSAIKTVNSGQELLILESNDAWYKVSSDKEDGWIEKENLKVMNAG